jgi:hypothetical protein
MNFEQVAPQDSRLLTEEESPTVIEDPDPESGGNFWREVRQQPGVVAIGLGLSSMILLLVLSQVLVLFNQLSMLPGWVRPVGYAGALLLCGVAIGAVIRFCYLYFRLRKSKRISLRALTALRRRAQLRSIAEQQDREARNYLVELLQEYPVSNGRLQSLGMSADEIKSLIRCRERLLTETDGSTADWLDDFRRQFLPILDGAANRRIKLYAKRSGIKTGVVHQGTIDTVIIFLNAYLMISDLCQLYDLRAGKLGTARILARVFVNTYAARPLDKLADSAADQLTDAVLQHTGHAEHVAGAAGAAVGGVMAHGPGALIGAKVVSNAAARFFSGGFNRQLMKRLGRETIRELRPLRQEKPGNG